MKKVFLAFTTLNLIVFTWAANPITGGKKPSFGITKPQPITTSSPESTTPLYSSSTYIPYPSPNIFVHEGSTLATICIEHDLINKNSGNENNHQSSKDDKYVEVIDGNVIVSMITKDPTSALFVTNRINHAKLIKADFSIGMRAIEVTNINRVEEILLQEVEYLQSCVDRPVGIFLDNDYYQHVSHLIDDLEYNIWPIDDTRDMIFPRVAHLMNQLPWVEKLASVEIMSSSLDVYNDFMESAKAEKLCLMHFKSPETIFILLGDDMIHGFKEEGEVFAIPFGSIEGGLVKDLPNNSYIIVESELELNTIDENSSFSSLDLILAGRYARASQIIAIGGPLLDITQRINTSLTKNCRLIQGNFYLETCFDFLGFTRSWKSETHEVKPMDILTSLKLKSLSRSMNFNIMKKIVSKTLSGDKMVELIEISSQNMFTNFTTNYHHTKGIHNNSVRFGDVFRCSVEPKSPYFFDGESVMYWRLKGETWVAAGMTAASLGIIVTLAILVFIALRITVGDVFEGNPVGTIMLLLSLVLLFSSFTPFAMEYASDHRNSHITLEDTEVLNTLCAVRVFLVTLCYCITFSILLCRAIMLASIGSEGGFLSHVNGYIQGIICTFSTLVQVGLSTQLIIVMHLAQETISCENIFYGNWLWALLAYDYVLLLFMVGLIPFVYRSQRNYREGILLVVGSILCFIIWASWTTVSLLGDEWRDAAIPIGVQSTGWAILIGILIPRTLLVVRGIERSDMAQAMPSLTSLAFGQNNQFNSEQSVYECVNPAMRSQDSGMCELGSSNGQSPSEVPTLPLRGAGARRPIGFLRHHSHAPPHQQSNVPPPPKQQKQPKQKPKMKKNDSPAHSSQSSMEITPPHNGANNKITRF